MVKIVFEFLDLLTPSSRNAYKRHIVQRFESFAKRPSIASSVNLEKELEEFQKRSDMNPEEITDKFELIRLYTVVGGLKNKKANRFATGPKLARDHLYSSDDAIEEVLALELTSDAPIVRCFLGLHELPDCTLWLLARETTAFCCMILRTLPISPFFESISRIWRVLDIFDPESDGTKLASHNDLSAKMGALGHEALVHVSETRSIAESAADNGWVGIYLIASQLNRDASVEQFSPGKVKERVAPGGGGGGENKNDDNAYTINNNQNDDDAFGEDPRLHANALPIVSASFAAPSASSSSSSPSPRDHLMQTVKKNFAIAKGITALGNVILRHVPELAENVRSNLDSVTPLLFTQQSTPIRKNFCFCKCFWSGVGAGVFGAVGAVGSFAVVSLVVLTTIRTFSGAFKGARSVKVSSSTS